MDWLASGGSRRSRPSYWMGLASFFLAGCTDKHTRDELNRMFNSQADRRNVLILVLEEIDDLSFEDLSSDASEWLIARMRKSRYDLWRPPLLARIATDEFVEERLLPLLIEEDSEPLRSNLHHLLDAIGRRHNKRYVRADGQPL